MNHVTNYKLAFFLLIINLFILSKLHIPDWNQTLYDFDVYHQMARDVRDGAHPYQLSYMQTAGPPLVILPFFLFSLLPLELARILINTLSLSAVLATSYLLAKKYWPQQILTTTLLLNILLLVTFPVRFNFTVGQPNLILMLFITLALTSENQKIAGILWGMIAVVKTNYLIGLMGLIKNGKQILISTFLTLSILFIVSFIFIKPVIYWDYVSQKGGSLVLSAPKISNIDYYNQSLRSTLARFNLGELYPYVFVVTLIISGLYLIKSGDKISGVLLSLILSPVIWQHYLAIVYPLLVMIGWQVYKTRRLRIWFVVSLFLLVSHLPQLHFLPIKPLYSLLASHYFVGLVTLLMIQIRLNHSSFLANKNSKT